MASIVGRRASVTTPNRAHHCAPGRRAAAIASARASGPMCSVCTPCFPPRPPLPASRRLRAMLKRGLGEDRADTRCAPRLGQRARVAGDAGMSISASSIASTSNISPVYIHRVIDRRLHPAMALFGAVAQADHPVGAALAVIAHFLRRLWRRFRRCASADAVKPRSSSSCRRSK